MAFVEVVAAIIWHEGLYLAAQRPEHALHAGYWEFPGGKVEAGEELEAALARELREELSIECLYCELWKTVEHVYAERQVRVHFFHVRAFTGQAQGLEGQKIQWVYPEQALQLSFLEADKALVHELHEQNSLKA